MAVVLAAGICVSAQAFADLGEDSSKATARTGASLRAGAGHTPPALRARDYKELNSPGICPETTCGLFVPDHDAESPRLKPIDRLSLEFGRSPLGSRPPPRSSKFRR